VSIGILYVSIGILYVSIGILLTRWKHLQDCIILLRGEGSVL
jgi:hypothetical protein